MPEYLAPGVYVEEVSFRSKSIEGVSTTTTGFVGPTRFGPIDLTPDVVTSLAEFERVYGDRDQLRFTPNNATQPGDSIDNYVWHAVRAFFEEGGKRLYVARVFRCLTGAYPPAGFPAPNATINPALFDDGHGRTSLPSRGRAGLVIRSRFPGLAGNLHVRFTVRLSSNVLSSQPGPAGQPPVTVVNGVLDNDIVWLNDAGTTPSSPPGGGGLFIAESSFDAGQPRWRFTQPGASPGAAGTVRQLTALRPNPNPASSDSVRIVTLTVTVVDENGVETLGVWDGVPPDPRHQRAGSNDGLTVLFRDVPANLGLARSLPLVITPGDGTVTGLDVLNALFSEKASLRAAVNNPTSTDLDRSLDIVLIGGNDGRRPAAGDYEGVAELTSQSKTGLKALEDLDDISIVAAPGSTFGFENGYRTDAATIQTLLVAHATLMRYRIAILDSGDRQSIATVRAMRSRIDSNYAAFYYPWVKVLDPVTRREINLPPSGFVAGIYARNDTVRAVYKAPANEVVNLALGFETLVNRGQQDVLNPEGINCFRFFEGQGYRLWGARLASSDPEWKYVSLRRYFAYLEHSIDRGTQWAVFEPNGPALWDNVRRTIDGFLFDEFQSGALLGDRPETSYFVRCDRTTMTQNDLDNGRLVCLVGVAVVRPAEFVIFRIGQWTADRKV